MTYWSKLKAEATPDTLAKIIESIEGGLLPMMKAMLPEPTEAQWELIFDEFAEVNLRIAFKWDAICKEREGNNGDDCITTEP